jgi:DNA-binding transcriptional LysR family regulator
MFPGIQTRLKSQSVLLRIAAVRAGIGIALLPCGLCDRDPSLVRLPSVATVVGDSIWALTHPDLRGTARIRVLMNFLSESFERHHAQLMGEAA